MADTPRPYQQTARWAAMPWFAGQGPDLADWHAGSVGAIGTGLTLSASGTLDVGILTYPHLPQTARHVIACPMHPGVPYASELVMLITFIEQSILPTNLAGSKFIAITPPSAPADFVVSICQGGVWTTFGTLTAYPDLSVLVPTTAQTTVQAGDSIKMLAPASPDATLADFSWSIPILRT